MSNGDLVIIIMKFFKNKLDKKEFCEFCWETLRSLLWENFNKIAFKMQEIKVQSHYFPNDTRIKGKLDLKIQKNL